mgnify:CR=1 FL=1
MLEKPVRLLVAEHQLVPHLLYRTRKRRWLSQVMGNELQQPFIITAALSCRLATAFYTHLVHTAKEVIHSLLYPLRHMIGLHIALNIVGNVGELVLVAELSADAVTEDIVNLQFIPANACDLPPPTPTPQAT